jgi:chromosome partitioning protein
MSMKIIALGQQKGGVGKSSSAIMLACRAAEIGDKTAILDMDAEQATALKWFKKRKSGSPHVEVCEAGQLGGQLSRLREEGYMWVFLDLPGRSAPAANAGLVAADLILIPCRPVDTDIEPSGATVQSALRAGKKYSYLMNISPPHRERARAKQVQAALRAAGHPVADTIIVQSISIQDAMSAGQGINEKSPGSTSDMEYEELFAWIKETVK